MATTSFDSVSDGRTNSIAPIYEASACASKPTQTWPLSPRVTELLADYEGRYPIWVRAPKDGPERYSSLCRSKLYELASKRLIRSVSIREPGKIKGVRLFHLGSILEYIARCEASAAVGGDQ